MARFYSRRYRRYRPRKYIRRYFRRRFRKFVNGTSRSQVRVKVPVSVVRNMTQYGTSRFTQTYSVNPFTSSEISHPTEPLSALSSPLYRTYASLYDEVQCIGMKVRLSFTNAVGAATLPAIKVHSMWDRRCGYGEASPSYSQIISSASYMPASAINNSVCKMQRSCYQSDLIEKAQWHDCSLTSISQGSAVRDDAYVAAGLNPNFFCPAFYFVVEEVPDNVAWVAPSVMIDVVYYFKFRNPRYGGSAAGVQSRSVAVAGEFAPGDDMDDDEQVIDLDANAVGSMSAMADMQAAPASEAPAPTMDKEPVTRTRSTVSEVRSANREARNLARRSVFGGRGSLNA